jgi:hypothetical protein
MNKPANNKDIDLLKNLVFVSVISADNDKYSEEVKQEIISRHEIAKKDYKNPTDSRIDWEYVFAPLNEDASRYIKIMKHENN